MACLFYRLNLLGAGVTLITHGNTGNADGWVTGMATNGLFSRFGTLPVYRVNVTYGAGGMTASATHLSSTPLTTPSGELVVLLNWSSVAEGVSNTTYQVAAAAAPVFLSTNLISQLDGHALAEFPLHLIGHSRGASVISEISRLLGEQGLWVDQVTTLDAHPLNNDGFDDSLLYPAVDAPVRIYENVLFGDSYYQDSSFFVYGEPVPGANWRRQTSFSGGYSDLISGQHSDVHLWYHGTIQLAAGASDTEVQISSTMRDTWYASIEQKGTNTGFIYSRLGGGDRYSTNRPNASNSTPIKDGMNQKFDFGAGTAGNRTALMLNTGDWPNPIKLNLMSTNSVPQGSQAELNIYYQWARTTSEFMTVQVWRDTDHDALNGNEQMMMSGTASGTTAGDVVNGSIFVPLDVTNAPAGSHFLFVRLSAGGRSRVLYAPEPLTVLASLSPPTLDIAPEAGGVRVGVNASAGQQIVLSAAPDLESWLPITTNTLDSARWEITVPATNAFQYFRAELLP